MTETNHSKLMKTEKVFIAMVAILFLLGLAYEYYDGARSGIEPRPFLGERTYIDVQWECYNAQGDVAQIGERLVYPRFSVKRQTASGFESCARDIALVEQEMDLQIRCDENYGNGAGEECVAYRAHYREINRLIVKSKIDQAWRDFKKDLRYLNRDVLSFVSSYTIFIIIGSGLVGYWWIQRQKG